MEQGAVLLKAKVEKKPEMPESLTPLPKQMSVRSSESSDKCQ